MTEIITVEQLAADESFQNWVSHSNKEDVAKWNQWIECNFMHHPVVGEAKKVVQLMQVLRKKEVAHKKKDIIIQDMRNRLSATNDIMVTDTGTQKENLLRSDPKRIIKFPRQLRWASVIVFILASSVALYYFADTVDNKMLEHVTVYGENKNFILPDGSNVNLKANSVLSTNKIWDTKKIREVWLKGEAYFSIEHMATNQRFVVHTDNGDVEVLGTTFNVYNRNSKTKVVLTSGKVKIISNNTLDTMILKPGEAAELFAAKPPLRKQLDSEKIISWKKDTLMFDNSSLEDIAALIRDNYGYEIIWIDDRVKKIKFTYTLVDNDLDLLLVTLKEALDIKIQKRHDLIYKLLVDVLVDDFLENSIT